MSIEQLQALGVEFQQQGYGDEAERVSSIRLPFTAEQFMDMCHREGELLPMCCGKISSMRDIVLDTLREGGWISIENLAELVLLMKDHEGFDDLFGPDAEKSHFAEPWLKVARAWEAVQDCAVLEYRHNTVKAEDPTDLRDAVMLVSNQAYRLWTGDLFHRGSLATPEEYPTKSPEEVEAGNAKERFQHAVNKSVVLARLLPALHTVYTRIAQDFPEPVEGYTAILHVRPQWTEDENGKRTLEPNISTDPFGHGIPLVGGGLAIYPTQAALDKAIEVWETRHPNIRQNLQMARVRVSVDAGITLLD